MCGQIQNWPQSQSRTLGQTLEKRCVHVKGYTFYQIFLRPDQNVNLDNVLVTSETELYEVKSS